MEFSAVTQFAPFSPVWNSRRFFGYLRAKLLAVPPSQVIVLEVSDGQTSRLEAGLHQLVR